MTVSRRAEAARRYPALAWVFGAVALALLLPSGLTLPNRGPSTLAEYAPVPGQGAGQAPIAALGEASSGSGGFAKGGAAAATTTVPAAEGAARIVKKAGTKRCVGEPARQTEDPLSPPCVAYFEGDNGGATARGVDRNEVVVVVQLKNAGTTGDNHAGKVIDCLEQQTADDSLDDLMCRGYAKYFNDRYQTYGRTVHMYVSHNASDVDAKYKPFATAELSPNTGTARAGGMSVGFQGVNRATAQQLAPRVVTFRPENEERYVMGASWVCTKLKDRPASHSGNVSDRSVRRVFGLVQSDEQEATRFKAALKDTCGITVAAETKYDDGTGIARLRTNNVTSVLLVVGNTGHATATNEAASIGWAPEWIVLPPGSLTGVDTNFVGRLANQAEWANAMGATLDIRRGALEDQPWYRAYKEGCPDCRDPRPSDNGAIQAASAYDSLAMLFYGIQAAGPRLNVANFDKGMHAIPARASDDPFRPAAYFGPGNYSFLKDAVSIWWDPAGNAPGSTQPGCWRLARSGRRFRAGEWPAGDDDLFKAGPDAPCQGETVSS